MITRGKDFLRPPDLLQSAAGRGRPKQQLRHGVIRGDMGRSSASRQPQRSVNSDRESQRPCPRRSGAQSKITASRMGERERSRICPTRRRSAPRGAEAFDSTPCVGPVLIEDRPPILESSQAERGRWGLGPAWG